MDSNATPPVRFTRAADGTSIAYMVWPGAGPPFLMVRSPGAVPMLLEARSPRAGSLRFAANRTLVTFDWRGNGESEKRLPVSLDDLVMDLAAVTEVAGDVPDVVTRGSSCLPAVLFAAANPIAWRSLSLLDPMVQFLRSPQGGILRPGWEEDYLGLLLSLARNFFPWATFRECELLAREWSEAVPKESQQAHLSVLASVDLTETLPAIQIPALVMKLFPRSSAAEVASLIPDGVLVELDFNPIGARGRLLWDTHIGARFNGSPAMPNHSPVASLSDREWEVLAALAMGKTNDEIATQLTVSTRTVDRHVQNIYTKIGVHNRVAATRWAVENGLG